MENIYSKVNPEVLLHIITRKEDLEKSSKRDNIVPPDNFIQCSMLNLEKDQTFLPHKHIWKEKTQNVIAQESWVVISGSVEVFLFDLDDNLLLTKILYPGDASFTLQGGHTYLILSDDTLVYEYKTGPYEGQEKDKEFIDKQVLSEDELIEIKELNEIKLKYPRFFSEGLEKRLIFLNKKQTV